MLEDDTNQMALVVKNPPANAGNIRDVGGFDPWVGKIPWRRKWQPTPLATPLPLEMATLSNPFVPGEYPWTEKPRGLLFMELQRVGYN